MNIGSRLGKYEILGQIGAGGMGSVFEARDPVLDRKVAIKVIASAVGSQDLTNRLFAEARASARLDHPNILPVFDYGDENGINFIVMPFVHGRTLEHIMAEARGPVPLDAIKTIVKQVASALDFAHAQGVVHRDVKPANIMIEEETNRAILMDFGVALIRAANTRLTQIDAAIGTINYMSPEQVTGKDVGEAADQYSLGLIAFEMLTGRRFFTGDSDFEIMSAHLQKVPPLVTDFRPDIPVSTATAIARALSKSPARRFANAKDFVEAAFWESRSQPVYDLGGGGAFKRILQRFFKGEENSDQRQPVPPVAPESRSPTVFPVSAEPAPVPMPPVGAVPAGATVLQPILPRHEPTNTLTTVLPGDSTRLFQVPIAGTGATPAPVPPVEERPRVRLVFKASANPLQVGKSIEVSTVPFRMGRAAEVNLQLDGDHGISRNHAAVEWINGQYVVRDNGSSNGTYVQGRRVMDKPEPLRFGATIRLSAATELMLVSDEDTSIPDWTGAVLDGRYRLEKLLQTSGKAALYQAADARLPQKVAIKILSPALTHYLGYLDDFQQEARLAAELQHLHILRVLDSGVAQLAPPFSATCHYVCLELMVAGSLGGRLRDRGVLPIEEAIGILDDASDALEYAHSQGVIHRGLKPSSLLFGHNGFVYVSDFAFGARSSDLDRRTFLGAPDFLAPEQWESGAVTAAADQYSLAALAYLMLAGSPPFRGQQDPDIRHANFSRGPVPVHQEAARKNNGPISPAVSEVLSRSLSIEPVNRYPSTRDFFLQLKRATGLGTAVHAGPPRVFISYQRDTSAGWALLFSRELAQKHGISAYVDTERLDSAVRFPLKLTRAIQECDVFVCLLSDRTLGSEWVREEIKLAWENNKPMVPVFQESYEQPIAPEKLEAPIETLISFDGVHLLDRHNIYVDDAITKLAKIVEQSVQRAGDTPRSFSQSNKS